MPVHAVSLGFRKEGQLECSDGIPCCICTLGVCRLLRFDVRRGDCRVPPPSPPSTIAALPSACLRRCVPAPRGTAVELLMYKV